MAKKKHGENNSTIRTLMQFVHEQFAKRIQQSTTTWNVCFNRGNGVVCVAETRHFELTGKESDQMIKTS